MWRRRLFRAAAFTILTPVAVTSLTLLYAYPELRNSPLGLLKANHRLAVITYAGLKMAMIYRFSND
jgi:hypothetical protein